MTAFDRLMANREGKRAYARGVVVTGSRHMTENEYETVATAFAKLKKESAGLDPSIIITGDCKGADALAIRYAAEQKQPIPLHKCEAVWRLGLRGGPTRNKAMLEWARANCRALTVIAFIGPNSKGTVGCVKVAERLKMRVVKYDVPN